MQQRGFGDLESVVMDRVWSRAQAVTVREIFDDLAQDRSIAYTTVLSTMDNLHRKNWLQRERNGKAYLYRPAMSREERSARLMREAFERWRHRHRAGLFRPADEHRRVRSTQSRATAHRWPSVMTTALWLVVYGGVLTWLAPPVCSGSRAAASTPPWVSLPG